MRIPRHSFPVVPKLTSALVMGEVKPESRHSPRLGIDPKSRSISANEKMIDSQYRQSPDIAAMSTFGESLPELFIETVLDSNCPNQLALLVQNKKGAEIRKSIQYRRINYRPQTIDAGLAKAVRFASGFSTISTTADLVSDIGELFCKYIDLDTQTVKMLTSFIFASWFIDCLQVAPMLWLHGPGHEVGVTMRLLNSFCYHPILLSDLDFAALRTLPAGLQPTLLVKQVDLSPRVERALLNSARRPFHLAIGKQPLDIFGARALHCESSNGQLGMDVFINPARRALPIFTDKEERSIADKFQSRLMAYRLSRHRQVQEFEVPAGANYPGCEDELRTWLAAIGDCPELDQAVRQVFAERRDEMASVHYEDPKCLTIESALLFCHKKDTKQFFVRELAERVNDLLVGRHADFKVEDRKVGSLLNDLGIPKRRVTKGFRVDLTPETRQRIHRIAFAYQVLSAQSDRDRCAECQNKNLNA